MKALTQERYGPPEVLVLSDVEAPTAGAGEVLVRVRAAGVDAGVWHVVAGMPYLVRGMGFGLRAPKNPTPGLDLAGVVEAVGPGVTRFAVGDEVLGIGRATFAEYAVAVEGKLVHKPAALSFEQAAAMPVSGITAVEAVRKAGVQAGERVLVTGAGGGVGSYAVQIARANGAHVTALVAPERVEAVTALGADEVIDRTVEEVDARGPVYDVIIDTAGRRPLGLLRRAMTPRGRLVIVGGEGGGKVLGGFGRLLRRPDRVGVRQPVAVGRDRPRAARRAGGAHRPGGVRRGRPAGGTGLPARRRRGGRPRHARGPRAGQARPHRLTPRLA